MIETIRRLLIGLALAGWLPSCSGTIPPPKPPEPPGPECPELGVPWCHEVGMTCGCKHHPPEQACPILADPCPTPTPTPQPTPTPAPPSNATDCDGPVAEPPLAVARLLGNEVNAAIFRAYGCDGGRCLVNDSRYNVQRRIIAELRAGGLCAGQHEPGTGPLSYGTDEIAVSTSRTFMRESYHVVEGPALGPVTLGLSPQSARPAYMPVGGVPPGPVPSPSPSPAPTPTPVPPAGCSAPLPPQVWTAETLPPGFDPGLLGHTRYVMTCRAHGNDVDCTVQNQRACDYCAAIGMGEMGGQIRCGCPVRNECKPPGDEPQNFKCAERVACEQYLTGGTVLESRNGATCEYVRGNPFVFRPNGGNCRLCGANGTTYNGQRQGCGEWL